MALKNDIFYPTVAKTGSAPWFMSDFFSTADGLADISLLSPAAVDILKIVIYAPDDGRMGYSNQ